MCFLLVLEVPSICSLSVSRPRAGTSNVVTCFVVVVLCCYTLRALNDRANYKVDGAVNYEGRKGA